MKWVGKTQGNKTILRFSALNISVQSQVHMPKISVCNQFLCHLLLECWIQRACYYEMMCENQYRMRIWIHSSQGSPEEELFRELLVWEVLEHPDRGSQSRTDKEGELEEVSLSWVLKQHPSTGRAVLEVRIPCRWGVMGVQGISCGEKGLVAQEGFANGLCTWLCFQSTGRFKGQGDKIQGSPPALQLPSVLWQGPKSLLVLLTQVPQKLSRNSCYLKWKQSLQPGGMPCGEVSRPWLSQEIICQFGI